MLVKQWGYSAACVKYDAEAGTLNVAQKEILKVTVMDYKLTLQWTDGEWEAWDDLQTSSELTLIKKEVQDKLSFAKEIGLCKGKGKSKE